MIGGIEYQNKANKKTLGLYQKYSKMFISLKSRKKNMVSDEKKREEQKKNHYKNILLDDEDEL